MGQQHGCGTICGGPGHLDSCFLCLVGQIAPPLLLLSAACAKQRSRKYKAATSKFCLMLSGEVRILETQKAVNCEASASAAANCL